MFEAEELSEVEDDSFVAEEQDSVEVSMSEWSSLVFKKPEVNLKRLLAAEGLYSSGSGEICAKYIALSDSQIALHQFYKYPPLQDPGIHAALLAPEIPVLYPDDGQELYLAMCKEANQIPNKKFHRDMLSPAIDLKYYGVNPAGVRAMAAALQRNRIVTILDLTDNCLSEDACYHLGQMLRYNTHLKELILSGCRMGPYGILRLGSSLNENRTLTKLDLSENFIKEQGGEYLARQIIAGVQVPVVSLRRNELAMKTAIALTEALEYRNKMTHLDLSWNNFYQQSSFAHFLTELATSTVLQVLDLSWCSLTGERIAGAISKVMRIKTLTELNLSNNKFQDTEVIEALGSGLRSAKKLITFDLSSNPLSPNDAVLMLQVMLKPRVKLQRLLLDNICVKKKFLTILNRVRNMKTRQDFVVTFGDVIGNFEVSSPDPRELLFRRADYLCRKVKKRRPDLALWLLQVRKDNPEPFFIKQLMEMAKFDHIPLGDELIAQFGVLFPGPKKAKGQLFDMEGIISYMKRLWPDKKLPPTPPPEPEPVPEPLPPPPPPPTKGKKGGKK